MKKIFYFVLVTLLVLIVATTAIAEKGAHGSHGPDGNGAQKVHLQPGWDSYPPLNMGKVIYNNPDSSGRLQVTVILDGAVPNANIVIGLADATTSANPGGSAMFSDDAFGMAHGSGCWSREGNFHCHEYWEFGYIQTDAYGNGSAHFDLYPTLGSYNVQFFLWKNTGYGGVNYESGGTFGTTVPVVIH